MTEEQAIERIARALAFREEAPDAADWNHAQIAWNEIKAIAREDVRYNGPLWSMRSVQRGLTRVL